ncbi:Spherulation-specific family 4-domain-containing protein [Phlyctochytrium arcticum]|nr:Spherulation-specific family 4-domain-containing protein [Phlyctochytrium arcticum]
MTGSQSIPHHVRHIRSSSQPNYNRRGRPEPVPSPPPQLPGVIFPLYIYPTPETWAFLHATLRAFPSTPHILVINPFNGPPSTAYDANYASEIAKLQGYANAVCIGYVATGYGQRDVRDVEAEIARWRVLGGVKGIFFDECAAGREKVHVYQSLWKTVHRVWADPALDVCITPGLEAFGTLRETNGCGVPLVTANFGTAPDPVYFNPPTFHICISIENSLDGFNDHPFPPINTRPTFSSTHQTNPPPSLGVILHTATCESKELKDLVESLVMPPPSAHSSAYSWLFITDDIMPNPYDVEPSYWYELVKIISGMRETIEAKQIAAAKPAKDGHDKGVGMTRSASGPIVMSRSETRRPSRKGSGICSIM